MGFNARFLDTRDLRPQHRVFIPDHFVKLVAVHGVQQWPTQMCHERWEPDVRKAALEKLTELLIGEYLRHLATDWWAGQPYSRSVATCDACSGRPVSRNKGYLIGSSLWCEDCYRDKDVEGQLRRNPDAAGYGVLQSARRWAQV